MRPSHLNEQNAASFDDDDVVECYQHRPRYDERTIALLANLAGGESGCILDIGTGTGELSIRLAPLVNETYAIDRSPRMITRALDLAGPFASHGRVHWGVGKFEAAGLRLSGPFDLIFGGESLHWLDWPASFTLFRKLLAPSGFLCAVNRGLLLGPAEAAVQTVVSRFSVNQDYESYSLKDLWADHHGFRLEGELATPPRPYRKTLDEWVDAYHSTSSLARARLGPAGTVRFGRELKQALLPYADDGVVEAQAEDTVFWGRI